jgi:hypothetical protein
MGAVGFVTTLILLILQYLGAWKLMGALGAGQTTEAVILLVGLVVSVLALLGLVTNKRWGWPLALIVFSASLANFVWIHTQVGASITGALGMGIAVFSMMIAFVAVDLWEPPQHWESQPAKWEEPKPEPVKKSTKKKAARKKASRKKSSRKKSTKKRRR